MGKLVSRCLSIILVLALIVGMAPMQILAAEVGTEEHVHTDECNLYHEHDHEGELEQTPSAQSEEETPAEETPAEESIPEAAEEEAPAAGMKLIVSRVTVDRDTVSNMNIALAIVVFVYNIGIICAAVEVKLAQI